jgi:hypothetical protein
MPSRRVYIPKPDGRQRPLFTENTIVRMLASSVVASWMNVGTASGQAPAALVNSCRRGLFPRGTQLSRVLDRCRAKIFPLR